MNVRALFRPFRERRLKGSMRDAEAKLRELGSQKELFESIRSLVKTSRRALISGRIPEQLDFSADGLLKNVARMPQEYHTKTIVTVRPNYAALVPSNVPTDASNEAWKKIHDELKRNSQNLTWAYAFEGGTPPENAEKAVLKRLQKSEDYSHHFRIGEQECFLALEKDPFEVLSVKPSSDLKRVRRFLKEKRDSPELFAHAIAKDVTADEEKKIRELKYKAHLESVEAEIQSIKDKLDAFDFELKQRRTRLDQIEDEKRSEKLRRMLRSLKK